ncbi:nucleotide sugar dehydrogenase [candidate division WOR-3 bacterium]|nr:nucleotide sugar dehydrogenase [candidate division WOR-3 bacterium]
MLEEKIKTKQAKVCIIGLGYVGLPLAIHFAKNGFKVLGLDIKKERVNLVNQGKSYIEDASELELKKLVTSKRLSATWDYAKIPEYDVIQICVPTPVDINKEPNISYLVATADEIQKRLRKEQLIILKSTSFPETTENVLLPILEKSRLCARGTSRFASGKVGKDFYLAFSPERIDPGNKRFTTENTPTVVGGITPKCTKLATLLYKSVIDKVISVSSARVAEMTKLLENTFRNVNIALVNELAQLCERMNINIWEVIDAAKTKPFGFMPFYPGPGVGGHCIPIDPYYLSWKAREYDFHTSFIELSAKVNESMPYYVANKVIEALSTQGVCPSAGKILILGVTFKPDVRDIRDSPILKLIKILEPRVKEIIYNDPYIKEIEVPTGTVPLTLKGLSLYKSKTLTQKLLKSVDCVIIATNHKAYDYPWLVQNASLIVDTRNGTKGIPARRLTGGKGGNIIRLGC